MRELQFWQPGEIVNGESGKPLREHAAAVANEAGAVCDRDMPDRGHAYLAAELRAAVATGTLAASMEPQPEIVFLDPSVNRAARAAKLPPTMADITAGRVRLTHTGEPDCTCNGCIGYFPRGKPQPDWKAEYEKLRRVLGRQSERIEALADALDPPADGLIAPFDPGSPVTVEKPLQDVVSITGRGVYFEGRPIGAEKPEPSRGYKARVAYYSAAPDYEKTSGHRRAPCRDPDCDGRCLFVCRLCGQAESELADKCPKAGAL